MRGGFGVIPSSQLVAMRVQARCRLCGRRSSSWSGRLLSGLLWSAPPLPQPSLLP